MFENRIAEDKNNSNTPKIVMAIGWGLAAISAGLIVLEALYSQDVEEVLFTLLFTSAWSGAAVLFSGYAVIKSWRLHLRIIAVLAVLGAVFGLIVFIISVLAFAIFNTELSGTFCAVSFTLPGGSS
jgi:hypothetical protein